MQVKLNFSISYVLVPNPCVPLQNLHLPFAISDSPVVTIRSFATQLVVITSKQRPRKLTIHGSDGEDYAFLLKGHEDLRQDERVMQVLFSFYFILYCLYYVLVGGSILSRYLDSEATIAPVVWMEITIKSCTFCQFIISKTILFDIHIFSAFWSGEYPVGKC